MQDDHKEGGRAASGTAPGDYQRINRANERRRPSAVDTALLSDFAVRQRKIESLLQTEFEADEDKPLVQARFDQPLVLAAAR